MFKRGISEDFVKALKGWNHWEEIIKDPDLFVAIRDEYINIYFQGCSLFKISWNEELLFETHYKYLVRPSWKNPYVSWQGDTPAIKDRVNEILIDKLNVDSLKKSSSWYAEAEKEGIHKILRSNKNVVDVEVALSPESEVETVSEDQKGRSKRVADRIDFAAIQKKDGRPCIVFFEAKRFDNGELKAKEGEPRAFHQIGKYQKFIKDNESAIGTSYPRVCKNLVDLAPNRYDQLVRDAADSPEALTVDSEVRLVVFGYDKDEDEGDVWNKHKKRLRDHFKDRLLLKGSPSEFTSGISK
jgi:hypothetical protein